MLLDDFDYGLPPELIAQQPLAERCASRLMVLDRCRESIAEVPFTTLPGLLRAGDLLVLNDTRVIPARLRGAKETGGQVEVFLVRRLAGAEEAWQCLVRASKQPRPGTVILLADGVTATVRTRDEGETWRLDFAGAADFGSWLERTGSVPLPPYIRREPETGDRQRYQTVFARQPGAVAAPTAGLHFTAELLAALQGNGVEVATLTLHVGLGTFLPVRVDDLRQHRMHREWFQIPAETAAAVNRCKQAGGRVVAVGTTVVRALEQAAAMDGTVRGGAGEAELFICPGHRFGVVDALLTNFHLPKSTLLVLVAAFAGREFLLRAYAEAVRQRFRFYSYGDAMFIHSSP